MIRLIILLTIAFTFTAPQAAVYKKVNPDGSVEYSDVPDNSMEEVQLQPMPTIPALNIPPSPSAAQEPVPAFSYSRIEIMSPSDDEGVRNNAGHFSARAELEPPLRPQLEHHIEWLLDDQIVEGQTDLKLNLDNLPRGTHRLQIRVRDFEGKALIESRPIVFHMLRVFQ